MNEQPEMIHEIQRWIEKAENDRRNAEYVLTMTYRCPTDTVCFHSQQCAEKYLKALLMFREKQFPRTHDLILLANLLADPGIEDLYDDLRRLNRYSVEARYPGEWEPISRTEAEKALQTATRVCDVIKPSLPPEVLLPENTYPRSEDDE